MKRYGTKNVKSIHFCLGITDNGLEAGHYPSFQKVKRMTERKKKELNEQTRRTERHFLLHVTSKTFSEKSLYIVEFDNDNFTSYQSALRRHKELQ